MKVMEPRLEILFGGKPLYRRFKLLKKTKLGLLKIFQLEKPPLVVNRYIVSSRNLMLQLNGTGLILLFEEIIK